MAIARPIYSSMLSAHTDSDFFGIGNPKVSQLFGLVVSVVSLDSRATPDLTLSKLGMLRENPTANSLAGL
jgi:hypothetical protein